MISKGIWLCFEVKVDMALIFTCDRLIVNHESGGFDPRDGSLARLDFQGCALISR